MKVVDIRAPVNGIQIERGVPLPPPRYKGRYPLHKMGVGDSFVMPIEQRGSLKNAAQAFSEKTGAKFTIRTLDNGRTVRIWRLS